MKLSFLAFLYLYCFSVANGTVSLFDSEKRDIEKRKKQKHVTQNIRITQSSTLKNDKSHKLKSIELAQLENYKKIALLRMDTPFVWDRTVAIKTGDMFFGTLIQNVLSTNIEAPMNVNLQRSKEFPNGGRLICKGITKFKRVHSHCAKLVTNNGEFEVDAQLLDIDGSAGLVGEFYSGKEEYVSGLIVSEAVKGILEISQQRHTTIYGQEVLPTAKNKLLQGSINVSNEVSDLLKDEMQTKEPKVFVKKDKKVIVYFNNSMNPKKGKDDL